MAASRIAGAMTVACRPLSMMREWQVWSIARPLRLYIAGTTTFALIVASPTSVRTHWQLFDVAVFAALLACGVIAIESTRTVREAQGTVGRDLQTVWYLAIAITLPPAYALLAPVPLTVYRLLRVRRAFVYRRVFSNATISLAYGLVSFIFRAISPAYARHGPEHGSHAIIWTGLVAGCGALAWIINNGLILGAIRTANPRAPIRDMFGKEAIASDLIELGFANRPVFFLALTAEAQHVSFLAHLAHLHSNGGFVLKRIGRRSFPLHLGEVLVVLELFHPIAARAVRLGHDSRSHV